MNLFIDAINWILDPANWEGRGSIPQRIGEHLYFTAAAVFFAALIAVPLGWLVGHTGRGRDLVVAITGAARALPSFGLLFLFVMLAGITNREPSSIFVLVLLAIPPILAGAYSGFEAIDRRVIDAARSMGMTEWQIVRKVEIPLGLPLLWGGLRSGVLQVVATVVLIGFIGLGALGQEIVQGIALGRYQQMLGASLVIIVLALVLDAVFALLERYATPAGVRATRVKDHRAGSSRRRTAAGRSPATSEEKERSV